MAVLQMRPCCLDIETSGLNPSEEWFSVVGAFSPQCMLIFSSTPENEIAIELGNHFPPSKNYLVMWAGIHFDIPFLLSNRGKHIDLTGFQHIDLLLVWQAYSGATGSARKDDVCRSLGIYVPKTLDGRGCALTQHHPELFNGNQLLPVFQHNAIDLVATMELHDRFEKAGWIERWIKEKNLKIY